MTQQVGLWMVGARGGVATTVATGLAALKQKLTQQRGLVSQLPPFQHLDLVTWPDIVVGGHEIRKTCLFDEALKMSNGIPTLNHDLVQQCKSELNAIEKNICPGHVFNVGNAIEQIADETYVHTHVTAREAISQTQHDLQRFATANHCERIIVINMSSTEPTIDADLLPERWEQLQPMLSQANCPLPASSLYAIAAIELGFPFINFTPSLGACIPAIDELANLKKTCHAGQDGKTGETFIKSVLAPAMAQRNLEVMSWVGHNILGNLDAQILDDPANKQAKVASKDHLLGQMLGYDPQTHVSIERIDSMGDWKTAWDHIHFQGFLETPMTMTFTWQGCDSILAAPLVLDLFRFVELAARHGEVGVLPFLSSFFKSPLGTSQNDFAVQFKMLTDWAQAI